jgi:uncharacterized protein YndB with AHSA1/START domain
MATESIRVSASFPAPPERIYQAWLSSGEHSKMTGGAATIEPRVGGRYSSWDGYIHGETVLVDPGRRIVQTWRTTKFPAGSPHSMIDVRFEAEEGGTRVVLDHQEIPEGQGASYEQGWVDLYFAPMAVYFGEVAPESGETLAGESPAARAARSMNAIGDVLDRGLSGAEELVAPKGLSFGGSSGMMGYSAAELLDEATPFPRDDEDTATDDLSMIVIDEVFGQLSSWTPSGTRSGAQAKPPKATASKAGRSAPKPAPAKAAKKATAKKAPARKTPAKKATAKKAPARKTPAKKAPAKKAPARKTAGKRASAAKAPPAAAAKKPSPRARRHASGSSTAIPMIFISRSAFAVVTTPGFSL